MNAYGAGCPPMKGNNDTLFLFLMLMIICPGMFGQMGSNPMIFMLIFMMLSGGTV